MRLTHVFSAPQSAYFFMLGQLDYMIVNGVEVTVIMPLDKEFNQKFKQRQPNVNVININFERNISLINDLRCLFQLIKVFKKVKPNIIHLHTPKASFLGALAARVLFKKNIIYQMHGLVSSFGNNIRKGLLYRIERITCSLSSKIFAVSNSLKQFAIENKYCDKNKISVIKNGTINGIDFKGQFNPSKINQNNSKLNKIIDDKFVIGFVGRLLKDKGIEDYLITLSKCKKEKLPIIGFVIGPDESQGEFDELLIKYNLDRDIDIYLFGQQLHPENYMVKFDILLLPTKREGFGLVGAEANALKIPVVGYDIPGFRDAVLNKETGLLVDFENTDKLFEAVLCYYKNPSLKKLHAENGRKRVIKDFESNSIWESLFYEYEKLFSI